MTDTKYLLDTSVLVDYIRGIGEKLPKLLLDAGISNFAIADLTLYELYCGAYQSDRRQDNIGIVRKIEESLTILPSSAAYEEAARQRAALSQQGNPIEEIDLLIACTAVFFDRILITGNVKHMSRVAGLKYESCKQ